MLNLKIIWANEYLMLLLPYLIEVKKMNDDVKVLNFIYQNSQMGVDTIEQLEKMVADKQFKKYLKDKYDGYCEIHRLAKAKLNNHGYDEKGISSFEKIRTYLMINLQTITDKSSSHIAEMLMIGSTMGIINALRCLTDYPKASKDILDLMNKLKEFEEKSYGDLQTFI